jgi:hypothetical protein
MVLPRAKFHLLHLVSGLQGGNLHLQHLVIVDMAPTAAAKVEVLRLMVVVDWRVV